MRVFLKLVFPRTSAGRLCGSVRKVRKVRKVYSLLSWERYLFRSVGQDKITSAPEPDPLKLSVLSALSAHSVSDARTEQNEINASGHVLVAHGGICNCHE
jgi:hypothetical protein